MKEAVAKLARMASGGQHDAATLPWHELSLEHTRALRRQLASELAPATANKHLAALRGVLRQCCRLGQMTDEAYRIAIDLPAVHGPSPRKSRTLDAEEYARLEEACQADTSPSGTRDGALIALLFGAGLRRAEVVTLDLADLDRGRGTITLKATASRPARSKAINQSGRLALERWLLRRGDPPGPLFNPINKGGRIELRRLSEQAIYIACHKRAAEAGLPPVSPEDLRRSLNASKSRRARRVSADEGAAARFA